MMVGNNLFKLNNILASTLTVLLGLLMNIEFSVAAETAKSQQVDLRVNELLARMTVVPYFALRAEALKGIVRLKMEKLVKRMLQNNKIQLTYTDKVVDQITERCTEVETGARNIDFILNGNVMPQMSQKILTHMSTGDMPSGVHLDVGKDGGFKMGFKK